MKIKRFYRILHWALLGVFVNMGPVFGQEIGIQLYSLREQFKGDVEGSLKLISDWGITALEGGGTYGLSLEEFKGLLEKYDLKVTSVGASFEDLQNDVEGIIKNAKNFGANYVMCAWIPHEGDTFTFEDAKKAVEIFNSAGKRMKEAGLTFAYHAHGYEFRPYMDGTLFDYMAGNAKDFSFEMDVYWVKHGGANPLELLNTYPDKFVLMHLKDMENGVEGNHTGHEDVETNVVLGTGQIDIAGLVKRAGELNMEYLFIEDESSRVVEQVPQSLEYLRKL
jgi:sugar phosphate isomerase/epimerase